MIDEQEQTNVPKGFEKVTNDEHTWWKPDVGDQLMGVVIENNPDKEYILVQQIDGTIYGTPGHTVLNKLLTNVNLGDQVIIMRLEDGEVKTGKFKGKPLMLYEVFKRSLEDL